MTNTKIDAFTNRLICGDCIEVLKAMPPESIDLVVTDPPFLVNFHDRDGRSFANDNPNTATWLKPAFTEIYRVLKPDRVCICFYGFHQTDKFLAAWRTAGFRTLDLIVWSKQYTSSEGFVQRDHESAYLLAKGNPKKPRVKLPSVLSEWRYTGNKLHPTQKPVMAILPLIMAFSQMGDIVLDPFAGSGTTAIAALTLNRRYIAIELDTRYAAIAQKRLSAAQTRRASPQRTTS
jgi:site-specific DNA-methyltransferase (adenine-specific)